MDNIFRQIHIENCKYVNKGGCATVYRLNEDKIVKVFDRGSTLAMIEREYDYSKRAYEHGIPTAKPYEIVDCGAYYGIIFEFIRGEGLSSVVENHPEIIPEMTVKYADILKKLHSTDLGEGVLDSIKPLYHEKIAAMEKWCTKEEAEKLHSFIDWVPDANTICHGDYHEKNILVRDGELILIDLADFTSGHPIFDLSVVYTSHVLIGRNHPELALEHLGMDYEKALAMWDGFIIHYFDIDDKKKMEDYKKVIADFGLFQSMISRGADPNWPEEMVPTLMQNIRNVVLPVIDRETSAVLPF